MTHPTSHVPVKHPFATTPVPAKAALTKDLDGRVRRAAAGALARTPEGRNNNQKMHMDDG